MADGVQKAPTVVEAETVIVAENTPAQETLAAAEARADNAERVAEEITDAAVNSAIVQHVEGEIEECQAQTEIAQSVAEDAHEKATTVEQRLLSMQSALTVQTELLQAMATRLSDLTPAPSSPSPTPEPEATDPAQAVPEADRVEAAPAPQARAKRYRLM